MKPLDIPGKPVKVAVLVLRGGGGHYATFLALRQALAQRWPHWQLSPVYVDSLGEALGAEDRIAPSQAIQRFSDRFYDFILKHGLGWLHLVTLHVHKLITWLKHPQDTRLLADRWRQDPPDLMLSVVPFHNRALWASAQSAQIAAPVVTLLTDFADTPPAYWIAPATENYLLCPTPRAVGQALAAGVPAERVRQTSGLVIHPQFYQPLQGDRSEQRQHLGLAAHRPTGVVLFGANGSTAMVGIARALRPLLCSGQLQLIFLCGRNQAVAERLQRLCQDLPAAVIGFTEEMARYLQLADFFIGKPGNVSLSEAIALQLPVIVEHNWLTLPQEREAARWVTRNQVGLAITHFRQIRGAVEQLLAPQTFSRFQANLQAFDNRAIFEVPALLEAILQQHRAAISAAPLAQLGQKLTREVR